MNWFYVYVFIFSLQVLILFYQIEKMDAEPNSINRSQTRYDKHFYIRESYD